MKNLITLFALIFVPSFFAISPAFSAEETPTWEFTPSATVAGVDLRKTDGDSTTVTTVSISVGAGYFVMPQLEADLTAAYIHISDNGGHTLTFLVGPTYNFSSDISDSIYIGAGIGETMDTPSSTTYSHFTIKAFVGKRFAIASHVTWSPEFSWTGIGDAQSGSGSKGSNEYAFTPIRLSILL
jgi:hypothetical protein